MLLPTEEVPTLTMEGWFYTLQSNQAKVAANQKDRAWGHAPLNNGGCAYGPPKTKPFIWLSIEIAIELTDNDSCKYTQKNSCIIKVKNFY